MREYIRSYQVFFPRKWVKWCIYIVYPLLVVGIGWLGGHTYLLEWYDTGLLACMIAMVEITLDTYMFFGVGARDTNKLEYIKTSARGMPLLRKALIADGARRFLSTAIIFIGVHFALREGAGIAFACKAACGSFVSCFLVESALLFTRQITNVLVNLLFVYGMGMVALVAGTAIGLLPEMPVPAVVLSAVLYIGITVTARKTVMKKAGRTYYDG